MEETPTDIPAHWDDESDDRLKCTYSIADVTVIVQGISSGDLQVGEGEEYSQEEGTKWDVIAIYRDLESKHGERKSTEAEAVELAVEFMKEFDEKFEADAEETYYETLESR
jgi:hypothetical protein